MIGRASALLAGIALIASSSPAQQTPFRPDTGKCPLPSVADGHDLRLNGAPVSDRFDLSYAIRPDGIMEVDFSSKAGGGSLLFIGVEHVSPPAPKIFEYLETMFSRLKPSEAFVEVDDVSYLQKLPDDKDKVIQTRGEPSYLGFIARQANVPVLPLEPPRDALLKQLRQRFPPDDIALAFVLRDVQIMRDRRRLYGEALEAQAARSLVEQGDLARQAGQPLVLRNVLQLTLAVNRKWPGLDWRQVPAEWFNPFMASSDTGSRFVNAVFADEMTIRDRYALKLLLDEIAGGKRIVALAGRSHAETQLQALNCLMARH